MRSTVYFFFLAIAHQFLSTSNQELEIEGTSNRLSGNVRPTNYKLELEMNEDFYITNKFAGIVEISLSVDENETEYFQLHCKDLEIVEITLYKGRHKMGVHYRQENSSSDFVTIYPGRKLESSSHYQLRIWYNGNIRENSSFGFYKVTYNDKSKRSKYLVATLFETMTARTVFPCFDEPAFKATFDVTITHPRKYVALANTKPIGNPKYLNNQKRTSFKQTPPISTYLVAFAVAEFDCKDVGTEISICTRPEVKNKTQLAAELTPKVLLKMKDYTGFSYDDMGLNKLDLFINPYFPAVGMENWGLVTYAEDFSLYDSEESTAERKQTVVITITHELSHQWIGNLVSLDWWSNVFLKEGFATYFGYLIPDEIEDYSNWELDKQFIIQELQSVLVADSLNTSLPLSYDTNDTDVLDLRFDEISYSKGASIVRMVDHFLGHENFKSWLHEYVRKFKFSISTPTQLWSVYDSIANKLTNPATLPPGKTFLEVMQNWTFKSGYPLLTVTSNNEDLTIIQEQFLLNGTEDSKWYVPITYTLSTNTADFTKTTTKAWLTPSENLVLPGIMKGVEWITLNNQRTGYYRVNYDTKLLSKLSKALTKNVKIIDEITRSQLLDDNFNLARSGRKSYEDVLSFLSFLKNDTSYYSWYSASKIFEFLFQRVANKAIESTLKDHLRRLLTSVLSSVPLNKFNTGDQIYTLKKVFVQKWACFLSEENCLDTSVQLLEDLRILKLQRINPNLRSLVYCYGLKFSEKSPEIFHFMWLKYLLNQVSTEKNTILEALGCVNNYALRKWYLNKILTDKIKNANAITVIKSVLSQNDNGVTEIIHFLIDNYDRLKMRFKNDSDILTEVISAVSKVIKRQSEINLFNQFVQVENIDSSHKETALGELTKAQKNLEVTKIVERDLKSYFGI